MLTYRIIHRRSKKLWWLSEITCSFVVMLASEVRAWGKTSRRFKMEASTLSSELQEEFSTCCQGIFWVRFDFFKFLFIYEIHAPHSDNFLSSDPKHIRIFVLDEADEMLSKGFKDQIYDIFQTLSNEVQVFLLSATMPNEVLDVTMKFMRDPLRILVKKDELTLEGIRQFYVKVEKEAWKFDTLCDIYDTVSVAQAVIFVNSRRKVEWLTENLTAKTFTVSAIVSIESFWVADDYFDMKFCG